MKKALITGITGQDGAYLTTLLLGTGYEVHGIIRRSSNFNTQRINHLYQDPHEPNPRLLLHYGDLTEATGLRKILEKVKPDEVYNLGAQSHVKVSFEQPEYTVDVAALGALRVLEAVRDYTTGAGRKVKVYQAGSSEMFGSSAPPQNELTPFRPRSPYAIGKVAAHHLGVNYREAYGMFIANGILFNHESPLRGETFVTRKITRALARIKLGLQKHLYLGNLSARRDWGFAGDFVEAMWAMLQRPAADDYVVATGTSHSVQEFLEAASNVHGLSWKKHVRVDPRYFRPTEVDNLRGDASKARRELRWKPKMTFDKLVQLMAEHDLELAKRERTLHDAGYKISTEVSQHE